MSTENPDSTPPPVPPTIDSLHEPVAPAPNLPLAIAAGLAAALIGAIVWAVVTVTTKMQIGWMAVGVGFLVGFAVGRFNPLRDQKLAYVGAALALLGCLLGNVFAIFGMVASEQDISIFQAFAAVDLTKIPSVMADAFSPMDLLFYGIAIYEGYKFSLKGGGKA